MRGSPDLHSDPCRHPVDARCYGTTDLPNIVEQIAGSVQGKLHRE